MEVNNSTAQAAVPKAAENLEVNREGQVQGEQPKFAEVWKQIQAQYGKPEEKPREIKKSLGKDDFLRIMITQLQHQDPTKPFEAEKLASEIAQITSVEQLTNVNAALKQLSTQNKPLERIGMTNLIGKNVVVDFQRFPHKEGQKQTIPYNLPSDANEVLVSVVSSTGDVVYQEKQGPQEQGSKIFAWRGQTASNNSAKDDFYTIKIEATGPRGQTIETESQVRSKVIGVSFEGKDPVLLVGDANSQNVITMDSVVRIENETAYNGNTVLPTLGRPKESSLGQIRVPGQNTQAQEQATQSPIPQAAGTKNPIRAPQHANVTASSAENGQKFEKGFPNGLSENIVQSRSRSDLNQNAGKGVKESEQ